MASVNELLQDEQIAHQVGLQRYSSGVVRKILALLNRVDAELVAQLAAALDRLPVNEFTVDRLEQLLSAARQINAHAYQAAGLSLTSELRGLTEYEAGFQRQLFESVVPPQVIAQVGIASISVDQVHAAAMSRPFQGRLLSEWMRGLEADRATRIRDAVRMGYVEQQTVSQIVQRVRGTRAKGYSDGVIEIDRRNAESVVRTAISHTAGFARDRFYDDNGDLVKAVAWASTLDSRTSPICQLRDGKQYAPSTHKPIGHSLPWLGGPGRAHWRCRSTSIPVLKSWRELGLDVDELPPGTRASMDGEVPADLTYGQWLKRQSAARQVEVLGPSRAALFRTGGLPIEKFSDDKGKWLTLEQLKEGEAKAFKASGLANPIKPPRGVPKDEVARFLASPDAQEALLERLYTEQGLSYPVNARKVAAVKAEQRYDASVPSLSAIRFYTGSGFRQINRRMRETGGTLEDRQFTALTAEGIGGIPVNRKSIWRAPSRSAGRAQELWDRATVGGEMDLGNQLQSFSTSQALAAQWALGGDLLLRVARPGVGAYIEPLTINRGEHEVLLPPGLRYRVVKKSTMVVGDRTMNVIDLEIDEGG